MSRVRLVLVTLLGLVVFAGHALAADTVFTSTAEIKKEAVRLGNEALEVVTTPVDTEGYGLVGTLTVAGAVGLTYVFDADIREKVQGLKGKTLDKSADAGSIIGDPFVHLGIAAAVYGGGALAGSAKWQETGEMLGEAALLADASGLILKEGIGRGRPFASQDKSSFRPFQFRSDYDSMPSLHTASSFAMASVLAATSESIFAKLFYYSAATFVGFSRIYQDKHWASDIVLGAALGELCGRVVTGYHARGNKIALVPAVSRDSAMLAVQGMW
ncbi:MAG TPA: phosphatase PAP2 family protein [Geobacteraceae bacterium]|nr:phosphatase PAP2 family protein [Geobacteraceae bacterium]